MYIRTKDGVYKVVDTYETKYVIGYTEDGFEKVVYKENIIKQSVNLAELCDEFVGIDKTCENGHQFLRAIPYKCANFWNGGVYGAIWTSKGLIYVAKINDKGELELI